MPLSPSAIDELLNELDCLEREQENIAKRIAAINLLVPTRPSQPSSEHIVPAGITPSNLHFMSSSENYGLRGAIKNALLTGPKPPGAVIHALTESSFKAFGKTPLDTRVYNELGRMKKAGLVKRDGEGRYALVS